MSPTLRVPYKVDQPLHDRIWNPYYWACEQPERPYDDYTRYDFRCRACLIAAEAAVQLQPDLANDISRYTPPASLRQLVYGAQKCWGER